MCAVDSKWNKVKMEMFKQISNGNYTKNNIKKRECMNAENAGTLMLTKKIITLLTFRKLYALTACD